MWLPASAIRRLRGYQMKAHVRLLCAFLAMLASATAAFGQAQIGSLLFGTVTDAHGAAVPGAKVTFSIPATGAARALVTRAGGRDLFHHTLAGADNVPGHQEGVKTNPP